MPTAQRDYIHVMQANVSLSSSTKRDDCPPMSARGWYAFSTECGWRHLNYTWCKVFVSHALQVWAVCLLCASTRWEHSQADRQLCRYISSWCDNADVPPSALHHSWNSSAHCLLAEGDVVVPTGAVRNSEHMVGIASSVSHTQACTSLHSVSIIIHSCLKCGCKGLPPV